MPNLARYGIAQPHKRQITLAEERQKIYRFKLILTGTRPLVWRRFEVDGKFTFEQLHQLIQVLMGWQNKYAYAFYINGLNIEDNNSDSGLLPGHTFLGNVVRKLKDEVAYVYDFHDFWDHLLLIESIEANWQYRPAPCLLDGFGLCPPEDSGGVHAYYKHLAAQGHMAHPLFAHPQGNEWNTTGQQHVTGLEVNVINQKVLKLWPNTTALSYSPPLDKLNEPTQS